MGNCIITFRSVTPAQRAERLLRNTGISCQIGRTPKWMEEQGCGYSVRTGYRDLAAVVKLLNEAELPYRKIYLRRENGTVEELEP